MEESQVPEDIVEEEVGKKKGGKRGPAKQLVKPKAPAKADVKEDNKKKEAKGKKKEDKPAAKNKKDEEDEPGSNEEAENNKEESDAEKEEAKGKGKAKVGAKKATTKTVTIKPKDKKEKKEKKPKKEKDPNAPKRPKNAYMFFSLDPANVAEVKKENPVIKASRMIYLQSSRFGCLFTSYSEMMKEMGGQWKALDAKGKKVVISRSKTTNSYLSHFFFLLQKWEEMAAADKARYDKEMADYVCIIYAVLLDTYIFLFF
jgi:hypothetical protein